MVYLWMKEVKNEIKKENQKKRKKERKKERKKKRKKEGRGEREIKKEKQFELCKEIVIALPTLCMYSSLGLILWELWYGRLAADELASLHHGDAELAVRRGVRPSLVSRFEPPEDWKTVIKACWAHPVRTRPTAAYCYQFFVREGKAGVHSEEGVVCTGR